MAVTAKPREDDWGCAAVEIDMRRLRGQVAKTLRVLWIPLLSRRQFDLDRWTHGQDYADLHGSIVEWLDGRVEAVESNAPWLDKIGIDVWDYCQGAVYSPFDFTLEPRRRASATCVRDVIAVYGFDGDLTERLGQLTDALSAAGWKRVGPLPLKAWEDSNGGATLTWQPTGTFGYPSGIEGRLPWDEPALTPHMWLSWCGRGEAVQLKKNPSRTRNDAPDYISVESSATEYWKMPETALEFNENVLVMQVNLAYYSNPNALARPYRIPRNRLPTPPIRH
jgi:hypothetical protein